jgi:transposase InsO family protein
MNLNMNDDNLVTLTQLETFTAASGGITFSARSRRQKYAWIEKILQRFWYTSSKKKNRSVIKSFVMKMTGYSDAQMTRLIGKMRATRRIAVPDSPRRNSFPTRYTTDDVARLAETDNAHSRLAGAATRKIFRREYELFGKEDYIRLKDISIAHLYNLRGRRQYLSASTTFKKTNPTPTPIGERRKPFPNGKPGYIRVDSVHQGDFDGTKGVYHINLVDEVAQWELVGSVEGISEAFLAPLLEELLRSFPFTIIEFHSDNGSEYINQVVAALLKKMLINQTKSRSRRSNDNALVEGKNGSIIRKHMGYIHIPGRYAPTINKFYKDHLNIYINYHRPCGYATTTVDGRGKEKKKYDVYETPYEHFKKLPNAAAYLREGITFEDLDKIALAMSDNECAKMMQKAKTELFKSFRKSMA